jgi:hypothetical protein
LTPELEREIILIRKAWKIAAALGSLLLCATSLFAGTVTGRLQTATGGAVTNGTLSFRLSQPAVLVGTASVVTSPASCYISAVGNIVGVPDPLVAPILSANTISGTLPAGTYYMVLTYAGASGESVASPESTVVLSAQGTLIVAAPVKQPSNATGYNVYIGTTSGAETLQASVTGFTQYSQTSALAGGAALPSSNSSICSLAFSDQLIPSGTYYSVNLVNKNGSTIAGFPQTWCTYGGQSGVINVSNGAPTGNCGTNGVFYPTPILAVPPNNAPQSISSPMAFAGSVAFTGPVSESLSHVFTNAGLFDNTKYNQYFTMAIGGCNNQTLYSLLNGGNETAAFNACIKVPLGATQRQSDAVAGMVDVFSGDTSPAVGVFGGALGDSTNARGWGTNMVFIDNGFATPNGYAGEFDYDVANVATVPHGILVTGLWSAQATQGEAIGIAQNNTAFHWPIGLRFFVGATNALDNGDAAIEFNATSAANNSPSQGFNMFAVPSGGGNVGVSVKLLPTGILNIDNPSNTHNVPGINLNNIPLTQTIGSGTSTSNGTAIGPGTSQAQPAISISGATTTDTARCALNATPPATWQTGITFLPPVVTANTVTPWISNGTTGSITPVAAVIRCTVTR